jgi:hypothetical protein
MRLLLGLIATCVAATGVATAAPEGVWRRIESVSVGGAHVLTIEQNRRSEDTPRLRIGGPAPRSMIIAPEGGLVTVKVGLGARPVMAANRLLSRYVYATPRLTDLAGKPLLVVFGQAFVSDPGSIRVIGFDRAGDPRVLLSHETFQLQRIVDLDRDGVAELVGPRSFSQSSTPCLWTYDPYAVFKLAHASGRFEYSEPLSKAYNERHYFGWAGPNGSEAISVNRCAKGGGRIVPTPR